MRGRWWKLLGVAGIVGVAATGVVLARDERRRRAYTPEEVRSRLRERYLQVVAAAESDRASVGGVAASGRSAPGASAPQGSSPGAGSAAGAPAPGQAGPWRRLIRRLSSRPIRP